MTDLFDSWFIRHFQLAMPLFIAGMLFGAFAVLAYGMGPAPSEKDAAVVFGLFGFMGGMGLVVPWFLGWWVRRPL